MYTNVDQSRQAAGIIEAGHQLKKGCREQHEGSATDLSVHDGPLDRIQRRMSGRMAHSRRLVDWCGSSSEKRFFVVWSGLVWWRAGEWSGVRRFKGRFKGREMEMEMEV